MVAGNYENGVNSVSYESVFIHMSGVCVRFKEVIFKAAMFVDCTRS